jgi:hypothetical protein
MPVTDFAFRGHRSVWVGRNEKWSLWRWFIWQKHAWGRASRLRDNYCDFADTKINCTNKSDPLGICT